MINFVVDIGDDDGHDLVVGEFDDDGHDLVVDIGDDDDHDLVVGEFDGGNRSHVRGRVGLRSLWKPQIAAASLRVTRQQPLVNSH